ncbi:retrovirus-related pol polyprotein from transposon TNT 1-94 [Tanacetum coccineum]
MSFEALQKHAINLELALQQCKPATFLDSLAKTDFSNSKSVTTNNVSNGFSKPITAQILPQNVITILKNTNVIAPGMYKLVEIILFIIDSGCSKYMTGNLKLLSNFMEKFLGTVKFENDQIAPILGYGDLVQGNITIKRVYNVEGLNHNLFSVGQFCDADLEVSFRKSTCYICDLKGNDLLTVKSYRVDNKENMGDIVQNIHVNFDELPQMASDHVSFDPVLQCLTMALEHDNLLFSPMFDELLNGTTQVVSQSSVVTTVDAPNQCQQKHTTLSTSTTVAADIPLLNIHTTPATTSQAPTVTATENINQAETNKENAHVEEDEFINIFSTPVQEQGETSPRHVDSTRRQLETDGEMCMFALTVSRTEPKNIKEAMANSAWIEAMQEELHQFDRLDVWKLVDRPLCINVINMKWILKNKHDEGKTIIYNKARLVAKGYAQKEGIDFE